MASHLAITLIPTFAILFLGIVVYFHNRKSVTNALFLIMSVFTLLWAIANFYSTSVSPEESLKWIRLVMFFAAPHAVFFLIFINNFPHSKLQMKRKIFFSILFILAITMVASITPLVFSGIEIQEEIVTPIPGMLMPLFAFVVLGSLIVSLILMIRRYFTAKETERNRWRMMLIGTSLSYITLITTNFVFVVFLKNTSFNLYGPLFMLPIFIGMSYAILRHNVLNIKAVAAEILTFIILTISLFEIFTANTDKELFLKIFIFSLFFLFGIFLIRSVIKEVESREKIQRLAQDLRKANIRLRELDQRKSEFVSIASHQLRTPLTAIKGYTSMILEGSFGDISSRVREPINRVFQSINRLVAIVEDFLTISRIEQNRLEYSFEDTDLKTLIEGIVVEMKSTAEKKGLGLSFTAKEGNYSINIDRGKISQVVSNLINNSLQYTPKGSIEVNLEKSADSKTFIFSVKDSGIGMTQETIDKLFQKFSRAEDASKTSTTGTGLGLYVASRLVKAHKGRIWAESQGKGQGSTFSVELPFKKN